MRVIRWAGSVRRQVRGRLAEVASRERLYATAHIQLWVASTFFYGFVLDLRRATSMDASAIAPIEGTAAETTVRHDR